VADLHERFDELCKNVLGPLVLGGPIHLVRPFGARLAANLGVGRSINDSDLALRIDVARVRRARLYAPVDAVDELGPPDFALLCGLNDLLQITNHGLGGPLTRGRYPRLLANVVALAERTPSPRSIADVLARHATFARVFELARTDRIVHWWTGSARFRGELPPSRLTAWKEIRRVHIDATKVPLASMSAGVTGVVDQEWSEALAIWLTRSPLTDLATAGRASPTFAWSAWSPRLPEGRSRFARSRPRRTRRSSPRWRERRAGSPPSTRTRARSPKRSRETRRAG
jgi:hypothetical protein